MKEIVKQTLVFWQNYWGEGYFQYLLLAAVLYLLIFRRKNKKTGYILLYLVISLAVFFCPITAKIIQKFIGELVYWRVLWIVPSVPVIAFAMTEFLKERKGIVRFISVIICAVVIMFSGQEFCHEGYFHMVNNYQQVPDEIPGICEIIKADAVGEERYFVAGNNYISSYLRVYDSSILQMWGREGRGMRKKERNITRRLYWEMESPAPDYNKIGKYASHKECDYLVLAVLNEDQKNEVGKYGYSELGTVGNYSVYRLEK